jgi:hypothetical protein
LTTAKTPPADLPERAASSPTPSTKATEPAPPASRTEPGPPRAQVVPPKTGSAAKDPWADYPDIPEFLRRTPNGRPNPPALGPPGDSTDDYE